MLIVFLLYLGMASTYTLGKLALEYAHPSLIITVRMISAGLLLLGIQYWQNQNLSISKAHWWRFLQLALFHIYGSFMAELWALQYVSGAQACLIYSLSPFVTALLNYFFFAQQSLTRSQLSGLAIGFLAFIPMVFADNSLNNWLALPHLALFISVCCASYGWLLLHTLSVNLGYTIPFTNGVSMLVGGLLAGATTIFIPYGFRIEPLIAAQSTVGAWLITVVGSSGAGITLFLGYTALLIIVANIIFYNVYGILLNQYSATFLSFAGFTTPCFAALFDWCFWGITPPWYFFGTLCMVGVGLYLFYQDELKQ